MFSTDDEDGDFLSPTGGAKLASLFGLDQATSQGNDSFQYTAPKQPRKSSMNSGPPTQKPPPPAGTPAVLLATAVHAYRYVNGQYMKQGKLGAAVLGSHTSKEYKLLLYASQQKPVTSAKIHTGFIFTVQPSNYCTFYDDQRQNWSVMFESEKAALDFCKEVCLSKVNSAAQLDAVIVQDLTLGEGQAVENGDSLEVAYTGWLLQNHTTGAVFDSNLNKDKLLRLKLGAGKVIKGWEEGMAGMKKGGRRLLVVPPNQAYGAQGVPNRVPANSTLIFETEIRRVKFAKDGGSERVSIGSRDSAAPSPAPSVESLGPEVTAQPPPAASAPAKQGDAPLRVKSNSISEQLTNPDVTKAKLISRMAKMGQPMLPFLAGPATSPHADSSDSEMEDPSVSRAKERPVAPSPQPVQITAAPPTSVHVTSHPHANPAAALMPVTMATATPQPMMPGSLHAFQPEMYAGQTVAYQGPRDVTSFLMTEARQHNTEIRLAVGKVGDKVDQLAAKVDDLQRQGGHSLGFSNVSMETSMIMHNIQRIIQENECLKKEVFDKSTRIEEQNRKIGELINQNQRYMEQSNLLMEQRNDSLKSTSEQSQARLLQAEQDKAHLTEELAGSTARVSELQLEVSSQQQKAAALQAKLNTALQERDQHASQLTNLQTQLEEVKETGERVHTQYKAEKQKRKEVELKLSSVEEELQDLTTEKDSLERTLSDRKRKWQAERERCDEELEEVRRSSQQELDNLRSQLRKARTSTDHAAQEQMTQLQAELEQEWQTKCDQALASAKEQQTRAMVELTEHRDGLEVKLTQLQEKFSVLKQSRESEEQRLLQQQDQSEELQALKDKYSALEGRAVSMRQQYETRVAELERRLEEQQPQEEEKLEQADTAVEVKRVMNGVFHSLRGEFDLHESYKGSAILGVLVSTIKNVTLQLLAKSEKTSVEQSQQEEEEDEDEENEEETKVPPTTQMNGKKEEVDDKEKEIDEKDVEKNVQKVVEEKSVPPEREEKSAPPEREEEKSAPPEREEEKSAPPEREEKSAPPEREEEKSAPPEKEEEKSAPPEREEKSAPPEREEEKSAPPEREEEKSAPPEREEEKSAPPEKEEEKSAPPEKEEEKVPEAFRNEVATDKHAEQPGKAEEEVVPENKEVPTRTDQEVQHTEVVTNQVTVMDTTVQAVCQADSQSATETVDPSKAKPQEHLVSEEEVKPHPPTDTSPDKDTGKHNENAANPLGEAVVTDTRSGPPTQPPPPPPNVTHENTKATTSNSLTGGVDEENGEEPFFKKATPPVKPPPTPTEDDDDELSMKGRPPPAPLFGDDDDDEDDLDWLS
ncbi:FK506-binding protein 15 isoform X2 [Alosa pseudoharengus]|uniref:FK506-binding protein 15 isoform X2 n=1 Tax=Alosa pseudoharengus TaxID=34774 RepID=UPI003F8A8DEA